MSRHYSETLVCDLQTLSDLIISNESRIMDSKNVRYYNKMRVFHFTACIRYQVRLTILS